MAKKKLTSEKAKEILHDKSVHGHPLTDKQRKFFGWIAGGGKAQKGTQLPTLYTSDPKDPRIKAYQDSLRLYKENFNQLKTEKANKTPIRFIKRIPFNPLNDRMYAEGMYERNDVWSKKTQGEVYPEKIKPIYFDINRIAEGGESDYGEGGYTEHSAYYKKPVQPVKYRKPEPKKEQPIQAVIPQPIPAPQIQYTGEPVYSPGAGSGQPSALVGFRDKDNITYIKPEDYKRFAVPKYGQQYIESQQKKRNGGKAQDGDFIDPRTNIYTNPIANAIRWLVDKTPVEMKNFGWGYTKYDGQPLLSMGKSTLDSGEIRYGWHPGNDYDLYRTITPYSSKSDIRRYTPMPKAGKDVDFIANYSDTNLDTSVLYEGEKHWNIPRFLVQPHVARNTVESEGLMAEESFPSKRQAKRNILADVYKYQMLQNQGDRDAAWKQAKKFMRKEVNPLLRGEVYRNMVDKAQRPLSAGLLTSAIYDNFFDEEEMFKWRQRRGEGPSTVEEDYLKNPMTDRQVKNYAFDWLTKYKKMSSAEAKAWIKEKSESAKKHIKYFDEHYDEKMREFEKRMREAEPAKTEQKEQGGYLGTTNRGFNYNPAWGGRWAMGGTLPGATGMMYARTGAPSNGPYAKKTKASAENGMTFYQHGLDWTPRNISRDGKVIKDDMGQWTHPGEITEIGSNQITMKGVPYPVLGISNTGDAQMMYPGNDYDFDGQRVTEYPIAQNGMGIQDMGQLKKLDQLTNFTNYNTMAKKPKKAQTGGSLDNNNLYGAFAGANKVIGAVSQVADAIRNKQQAKQSRALSELALQASATRPEQTKRRYTNLPEENLTTPGQTYDTFGKGSFPYMQDGGAVTGQIGGTPTEIQNMYNPGDLYTNLGYEPLGESLPSKQYKYGGKAQFGMIAQGVGQAAQTVGSLVSGLIDLRTRNLLKQSQGNLAQAAYQQSMQSQPSPYMQDGGYLSHNWQPQVIAYFGEHKVSDLLRPDTQSDIMRAGGHVRDIRSNYMGTDEYQGMMAMGGQLKTHWGGDAELMSYNPYSPGSGETWMLKGNSHEESDGKGRTGIGITYGNNMVEAERGEPVAEVQDGGQLGESAVVYGNLPIGEFAAAELGDPKAKGKKFKNYIADLTKKEQRSNKAMEKAMDMLQNVKGNNPFNMLEMSTAQAMLMGADMKLKDIAMKKHTAAELQDVFNQTAEEHGLDADALAAGRIKQAKFGGKMSTAQDGSTEPKLYPFNVVEKDWNAMDEMTKLGEIQPPTDAEARIDSMYESMKTYGKQKKKEYLQQKREKLWDKLGTVSDFAMPYVRSMGRKPLAAEQILPEITALSLNQLEPVQAQLYRPMLQQVSKIATAQPKLNEINAQFNAVQKLVGNTPAALDYLAAQKYKAISQAVGEEFAMNQQRQDAIQAGNIASLNDAALKNLSILDQQFQRQAAAKSATKAQAIGALSSIASKVAQNKLENLTMGVYENMYNYRFGPRGMAYNLNPLARFNTSGKGTTGSSKSTLPEGFEILYDAQGNPKKVEKKTKESDKNGGIVKAIKNL